jgi:hypothetical protein
MTALIDRIARSLAADPPHDLLPGDIVEVRRAVSPSGSSAGRDYRSNPSQAGS